VSPVPETPAAAPVAETLRRLIPAASIYGAGAVDMTTIYVDREHLVETLRALRDDRSLQFALLSDLTAVDLLPAEPRFEVVYHLACLGAAFGDAPARRLRLKVRVPGADPRVASATPLFPGAGWPEREVFDLMGISFDGHPDLRRILTPDDWQGHPLRKDYPVQVRKDTPAWSPLQLTPEEFAANVRDARARSDRAAGRG
jgi:NADH-quinone oxidoreductase subunit C